MDFTDMRAHLNEEYARALDAARAADPRAQVPTCPEWTVDDLARHLAEVYLHKAEAIRLRAWPRPWPPERGPEPAEVALATSWAALSAQLDAHQPGDPARTWHEPDQTVGFWIRRMAHETTIHRVDAELAAGRPVTPIAADLAEDNIDEVLKLFLDYGSHAWADQTAIAFDDLAAGVVRIVTPGRAWVVATGPDGVSVGDSLAEELAPPPGARVDGDPAPMALWLWRRGGDEEVRVSGEQPLVDQLRRLLVTVTQ